MSSNINKSDRKATELCGIIEELQKLFRTHKFEYARYSLEEDTRIRLVKKFFGLKNTYDLIILCSFIEAKLAFDEGIELKKLVNYFSPDLQSCVKVNNSLKFLLKKHLIVLEGSDYGNNEKGYVLSQNCMTGILSFNRKCFIRKMDSMDEFLKDFNVLLQEARNFPDDETFGKLTNQIDEYASTPEIKWLRRQKLSKQEEVILCMAVRNYTLFGEPTDVESAASIVSNDSYHRFKLQKNFISGKNRLILKGYLCFVQAHYITKDLKLTDMSIQGLCASGSSSGTQTFYPKRLTLLMPDQIPDETYIHDNPDLRLIENMVSRDTYEQIRLKVPRLTVLLTGAPGVGKTAFINHLAKKTGRPVLSANIAGILSCYVGDSEKNLVQLFSEAETAYDHFEVTPLIVLDEAESLLYKRQANSQGDVTQMNNNLISLLLMSLDKFKGILICCSNFSFVNGNFDPALHRRFHTITEVMSPPINVLESIFCRQFPECSDTEVHTLLSRYQSVTPAQIRKLRDKYDIHLMLGEPGNTGAVLSRLIEQDLQSNAINQRNPIGFVTCNRA